MARTPTCNYNIFYISTRDTHDHSMQAVGWSYDLVDIAVVCGCSYPSFYLAEFLWERSVGNHDLVDITVVVVVVGSIVGGRGRIKLPRRNVIFLQHRNKIFLRV